MCLNINLKKVTYPSALERKKTQGLKINRRCARIQSVAEAAGRRASNARQRRYSQRRRLQTRQLSGPRGKMCRSLRSRKRTGLRFELDKG